MGFDVGANLGQAFAEKGGEVCGQSLQTSRLCCLSSASTSLRDGFMLKEACSSSSQLPPRDLSRVTTLVLLSLLFCFNHEGSWLAPRVVLHEKRTLAIAWVRVPGRSSVAALVDLVSPQLRRSLTRAHHSHVESLQSGSSSFRGTEALAAEGSVEVFGLRAKAVIELLKDSCPCESHTPRKRCSDRAISWYIESSPGQFYTLWVGLRRKSCRSGSSAIAALSGSDCWSVDWPLYKATALHSHARCLPWVSMHVGTSP